MSEKIEQVISLYNGQRSSVEVARIVGLSPRYVRRIAKKHSLERLHCGAQPGENNHQFVSGRRIDQDGYVLVTAPKNHPYARQISNRSGKIIYEHRLVMESKLGRYLLPNEVVDHMDGLTLHNSPENLRPFSNNGEHLHHTIMNHQKLISASGRRNISIKHLQLEDFEPVDTYGRRRKRGDVRLLQILLALLKLGKDSPYLLGTKYWLEKAQIFDYSRSNLEHELALLYQRWEQDLAR